MTQKHGLMVALLLGGCAAELPPQDENMTKQEAATAAPVAAVRPKNIPAHGGHRADEYYWLRDDRRKDPDVLAYLEAENAYLKAQLGHTDGLQKTLYRELVERMDPTESSVPVRHGEHYYYERYEADQEQPLHARRLGGLHGREEILLDENQLGADHKYYDIGNYEVSDDDRWLVWTEDTVSRRVYDVRFKNLTTGETLPDKIAGAGTSLAIAADNQTLFYVKKEPKTLRTHQVWRHRLGGPTDEDVLVYEETDSEFWISVWRSRNQRHIMLYSASTLSSEVSHLPADEPGASFQALLPRAAEHEYDAEPLGEFVYLRSNRNAPNFRIVRAPLANVADQSSWQELVGHRSDVLLEDFTVFEDYLVTEETRAGIKRLQIVPLDGSDPSFVETDDPVYVAVIGDNPNTDTEVLRYEYSSPITPATVYDLNLRTGEREQRDQEFAGSDFVADRYRVERAWATVRDGTRVPVTLLMLADTKPDGTHPAYLLGYGAYGAWYEPDFRADDLSLVNRGFVLAIAHVRGGQEMGRRWYDDGKLLNKKNTFTDFIDVARFLVDSGWAHPRKVVGTGRSAGGLLIGAVANMAPETFEVLVTEVPFVDVMTTMEDESIPLTTFEYDEWGDPADKAFYDYMLSYSPYDQVKAQDYPHMLVSTGLWDSQVQYWEPAKWVARLRRLKTDDNRLLLYTDMNAGHGGGSGRYERQRDTAREYAFILDTLGMTDTGSVSSSHPDATAR